jgi:hypothetical protein
VATPHRNLPTKHDELVNLGDDYFLDPEEGRRLFDEAARELVGMSGEEFIRRFDAGEYADMPDDLAHRHIIDLALLIPFGRQEER